MHPFLRIGRRQFLRNSALGLGVAPLIKGVSASNSAGGQQKPGGVVADSTALTMRATFGAKVPIWIVREPNSGFQQQLASRELARGLRNLGSCPGTYTGRRRARATSRGEPGLFAFHQPREHPES